MVDGNNKAPTEMHTFLPVEDVKDGILTSKYKVQVISKDPEAAATLTEHKNFDPFTERKHDNPTSDCDTLTHLLKASLGTGILSMPCAFRSAGLLLGIIATMLVSLICTHCSYVLVKCAHVLYHRTATTKMGFADVAETAFSTGPKWGRKFAKFSRYFVQISLFLTYFGTCSAYTVIIAANFGQVIDQYLYPNNSLETVKGTNNGTMDNSTSIDPAAINFALSNSTLTNTTFVDPMAVDSILADGAFPTPVNKTDSSTPVDKINSSTPVQKTELRVIISCLLLPLILLVWVPDLKYLAPVSMIANAFMGVGLGITFYYIARGMNQESFAKVPLAVSLDRFPQFFSITIFAMEAIGVIMPLENNMKTPQHFVGICGVLNKGMSSVTLVYILLGFLGYVSYPDDSYNDIITMDLPSDEIPAQIVKVLIGLAVYCTFGLQFYVCLDIAWSGVKERFQKNPRLAEYILRTVMVVLCVLLAILVPTIKPLVGLIGAFCFSILGILAPILLEMVIYWDIGFGPYNWVVIKNIFLCIAGFSALIFGSSDSIKGIIYEYTKS